MKSGSKDGGTGWGAGRAQRTPARAGHAAPWCPSPCKVSSATGGGGFRLEELERPRGVKASAKSCRGGDLVFESTLYDQLERDLAEVRAAFQAPVG